MAEETRIVHLVPQLPDMPKRLRVAAYVRVSLVTDTMLHSLSAQVSHYSRFIQQHPGWIYAGVYADRGVCGAKKDRPEFQRLMRDCYAGKIDLIITKSVSRFARNVSVLLSTLRGLSAIGVDVYFEEQNVHSASQGEWLLSIAAAYAEAELYSISDNIKWRKRHAMKTGNVIPQKMYGYEVVNGALVIVPEEAQVIRRMAEMYLSGLGWTRIAKRLNEKGMPSPSGIAQWKSFTVGRILKNQKLVGNILVQNTYVSDPVTGHQVRNHGELPMYLIKGTHEGILSDETFRAIVSETKRRSECGGLNRYAGIAFRKKIVCGCCGQRFIHTRAGKNKNVHGGLLPGHAERPRGLLPRHGGSRASGSGPASP